ncbi:MAG: HAD family phosphatase [Burkholderiaceae bacterium]
MAESSTPAQPPIGALLFDLGEVVVRIDWTRAFASWARASGMPPERLAARFAPDDAYRAFERGEITAPEYYAALRRQLGLDLDDEAMRAGWNAIFAGLSDPVVAAIRHWRQRVPVFAFSNTNREHRRHFMRLYAEEMALFTHLFDSSELGARKPEAAAFEKVIASIGQPAGRILFFDDLADNVAGARAAGLRAVQVTRAEDVTQALGGIDQAPPYEP